MYIRRRRVKGVLMVQTGTEIDLWRNISLEVFGRYDWSGKLELGDDQAKAQFGNNSSGSGASIKFTFYGVGARAHAIPL